MGWLVDPQVAAVVGGSDCCCKHSFVLCCCSSCLHALLCAPSALPPLTTMKAMSWLGVMMAASASTCAAIR